MHDYDRRNHDAFNAAKNCHRQHKAPQYRGAVQYHPATRNYLPVDPRALALYVVFNGDLHAVEKQKILAFRRVTNVQAFAVRVHQRRQHVPPAAEHVRRLIRGNSIGWRGWGGGGSLKLEPFGAEFAFGLLQSESVAKTKMRDSCTYSAVPWQTRLPHQRWEASNTLFIFQLASCSAIRPISILLGLSPLAKQRTNPERTPTKNKSVALAKFPTNLRQQHSIRFNISSTTRSPKPSSKRTLPDNNGLVHSSGSCGDARARQSQGAKRPSRPSYK